MVWLRKLLEDEATVKVIHDCRMDSDALFHLLQIDLKNVHDTSCWHNASGYVDKSLNDTLMHHKLGPNCVRDGSVYKENHAFWATRPLTAQMVEWASGDVRFMFELYHRQVEQVSHAVLDRARTLTIKYLYQCRTAKIGAIKVLKMGLFIGKDGANVRQLKV